MKTIIDSKMVAEVTDRICNEIVKQSDSFKKHQNKQNFLDNVTTLIEQRTKFTEIFVGSVMVGSILERFDKNEEDIRKR